MTTLIARDRRARRRRTRTVVGVLALLTAALFVVALLAGTLRLPVSMILSALFGQPDDPSLSFLVEQRVVRAATAVLAGAAMGVAGTVFQRLLANPLASPDVLGVSAGASLAAAAGAIMAGLSGLALSATALVGALVGAAAIYALSWRSGVSGYRFVLVGIGVAAFALSLVGYVLTHASAVESRTAMRWLVGSIGMAGRTETVALAVTVALLLPLGVLLGRALRALELGDETARVLGLRVERGRLALLAVAVGMVAMATAVVGPIMFVALVAGPISQRLLGPAGDSVAAAALAGATVTIAADLLAQHVLGVPTGVVTGAIGAPFLIAILVMTNKEGRGG